MPILARTTPATENVTILNKKVFGAQDGHEKYHILPFSIDRTNLFVGKVEMHVFETYDGANPTYMDLGYGNNIVAIDVGISEWAKNSNAEPPWCVGIERRYDEASSMAIYTYTFEGIATKHYVKYVDFELEFTMEQMPIETHPNFQNLNDIYGPYDSLNRLWPAIVTPASASTGLQQPSTSGGPITNPIYGVTSYLVPGCIFRKTWTSPDIGANLLNDIGVNTPAPDADGISNKFLDMINLLKENGAGAKRNWLKMAPKVRQHGSCTTITLEWMLSGPRGWLEQIYGSEALDVEPRGGVTPGK